VDEAWDVLVAAQQADPTQVAFVLGRPQVGAWAARVLRRLHLATHDDVPLWVDVGQLHTFAAAAAVRAGLQARISVPAWRGQVILPTLGCARGPYGDTWEPAVVETDRGALRVSTARWWTGRPAAGTRLTTATAGTGPSGAAWRDTPWLRVGPQADRLAVEVDDTSPYRMLSGVTSPARSRPATLRTWECLLEEAWELLLATIPGFAQALAMATTTLVPLPAEDTSGFSVPRRVTLLAPSSSRRRAMAKASPRCWYTSSSTLSSGC